MRKQQASKHSTCRVAVIWIDWYPYHVARFRGLDSAPGLQSKVVGIELVGGMGVHTGLKFREDLPVDIAVTTLQPNTSWREVNKGRLALQVWRHLSERNPEVVLVPGYYTLPAIAAALWARLHGRISVLMMESTAGDHPRNWWKELPKRLALRLLFSWAVTGGKAHVAYLRQLGFPANRIVGSYDVVDNAMFREGTRALRVGMTPLAEANAESPSFLFVGRLSEEKNVSGLLAAWRQYREHGGMWPLVLCGDGPERNVLQREANASGYGAEVRFAGLKSLRELLPFYAHAGCFILPSTREPWGLVVNEAMAAGLPVLVSQHCGCVPDLVDQGRNGFCFDPLDIDELTKLLHRMEQMAETQRVAMGRASEEIVSRYSPEGFGASIARIVQTNQAPLPRQTLVEVSGD